MVSSSGRRISVRAASWSAGSNPAEDLARLAAHVEALYDGMRRLTATVTELVAHVEALDARVAEIGRAVPWTRPPRPKPVPNLSQPRPKP